MIVVDVNIIAYLYLAGTHTTLCEQLLLQDPAWEVPFLWRSEFNNILASYLRKKLLTLLEAKMIIGKAEAQMNGHEHEVSSQQILSLASDSSCTAYDCEYVALALSLKIPLLTFDKEILNKFKNIAVHPLDFVKSA